MKTTIRRYPVIPANPILVPSPHKIRKYAFLPGEPWLGQTFRPLSAHGQIWVWIEHEANTEPGKLFETIEFVIHSENVESNHDHYTIPRISVGSKPNSEGLYETEPTVLIYQDTVFLTEPYDSRYPKRSTHEPFHIFIQKR